MSRRFCRYWDTPSEMLGDLLAVVLLFALVPLFLFVGAGLEYILAP